MARGNINFIRYELNKLLQLFRINLDPICQDYRKVAIAVIKAEVRALEDVRARNRGEAIDSPKLVEPSSKVPVSSCSLRAAYEGWDKMEHRPTSTRMEFSRGIDRFIELHGDLDVGQINKRHVREFREAAQLVPKHRPGKLRKARLPELVEWTRENPGTVCITAATINKWLTCLQGVLNWARRNGVIPDEVPWADPVAGMRLKEPRSKRRPWEPEELMHGWGGSCSTPKRSSISKKSCSAAGNPAGNARQRRRGMMDTLVSLGRPAGLTAGACAALNLSRA